MVANSRIGYNFIGAMIKLSCAQNLIVFRNRWNIVAPPTVPTHIVISSCAYIPCNCMAVDAIQFCAQHSPPCLKVLQVSALR